MLIISKSGVLYPVTMISLGSNLTLSEDSNGLPIIDGASAGSSGSPPVASTTVSGTVKTDSTIADPVVYLKGSVDTLLAAKANLSGGNSFSGNQSMSAGLQLTGTSALSVLGSSAIATASGYTHLFGTTATNGGFLQGVGMNSYFDGTNYRFPYDGANNGGVLVLGGVNGDFALYTVGTSGTSNQSVSITSLNSSNRRLWVQSNGNVTITSPSTLITGATGDLFAIHDNATGGTLTFRSDGSGQTKITFGSSGTIAGAASKLNLNATGSAGLSLQISGTEKALVRADGIFYFNSGSWEKLRLETGATGLVRLGSDSNGMNLTTNASWNGSAWVRDDTTKASFALIQHLGSADVEFRVATANTGNINWITPFTIAAAGDLNITGGIKLYIASNLRVFDGSEDGVTSFNTIRSSTANLILNAKSGGGLYFNYGHGNIVNFCNGSQSVVATVDNTGKGTFVGLVTSGELSVKDASLGYYKTSVSASALFTAGISGANGLQFKRANASADTKMYWLNTADAVKASIDFESGAAAFVGNVTTGTSLVVNGTNANGYNAYVNGTLNVVGRADIHDAWIRDPNYTSGIDTPLQLGRMNDTLSPFMAFIINDATDDLLQQKINRWGGKYQFARSDSTLSTKLIAQINGGDGGASSFVLYDGPTGSTNPVNVQFQTQGQSFITGTGVALGIGVTANTSGYMLDVGGSVRVNGQLYLAANGQGIKFTDDGDFADLNDGYLSLRFSNGVRVYSANASGSSVLQLGADGKLKFGSNDAGIFFDGTYTQVGQLSAVTGALRIKQSSGDLLNRYGHSMGAVVMSASAPGAGDTAYLNGTLWCQV